MIEMVTIKDGCGCDPCDCDWKQKLKEAYARASVSVNKVGDFDGSVYFPDGSGFVKLPIPKLSEVQQISRNAQDIADLKVADNQLQTNITAEENARKAKDENLDSDIARIDSTDARQSELIRDNADRITSTYNDLVATEATVATHDSEIITLQANNQALTKSLVSDVIMTDGTTAGSVQVSIERADGALITSANYRWGRDIGIRLEAGTQAGYVKAVISLSDGTELVSNEYKIVEVLESDVYVTAITLVPDMTAGTIGGNISYSNGSTQTINSVSVPTAPGVTSAIEALQGRMTAVEQKNTTQDADITSLKSRVQAIEDTPGVGQFGAGKLGTIAGSTTDGRIKAEDDGTGSVNGWSALKQRVSTAEGQIVTAQNDISALDGTVSQQTTDISGLMTSVTNLQNKDAQQDTAIAGKVAIAQGAANAGKALVVGSDGNVTPGKISGGEVWEEINMSNFPTDWVNGDRIKLMLVKSYEVSTHPSSWTSPPLSSPTINEYSFPSMIIETTLYTDSNYYNLIKLQGNSNAMYATYLTIGSVKNFNGNTHVVATLSMEAFNGAGRTSIKYTTISSADNNLSLIRLWRLKK